ncbi:MAG: thioesterase family protein [Acidimicrobiales bacterium]
MAGSYFVTGRRGLHPLAHASGPWSDDMLHGRLLGALAARAVEALAGHADFVGARLTVDLFKAAPMEPVQVRTTLVREGRRIRVADATVHCAGHDVARASAVFLRRGPEPPGTVWRPERWVPPPPSSVPVLEPDAPAAGDGIGDGAGDGVEVPRWEFRPVEGGFASAERTRLWSCEHGHLVDDEPLSPFVRAAISADIASPLANSGDDGLHYINADYSLSLAREPRDRWIGLEVSQHLATGGVALGACTLYDLDGPFATSTAVALANPPLRPQP